MTPAISTEPPIVDGFTLSASMLYLPTTYRAHSLAQMEVLRRAKSYRARQYVVPDDLEVPINAYDQLEYQVASLPGSYLWGIIFSVLKVSANTAGVTVANAPTFIHIQITDACTETPLLSDYTYGNLFTPSTEAATQSFRNPFLINPRLLGQPAHLDCELYNRSAANITCQLMLCMAEPQLPPEEMDRLLREMGYMV